MRERVRQTLNWIVVAGFAFASALLLAFALSNAFYMVLGERAQLALLRKAPCGLVKHYVSFVLEDTDAPLRSTDEKMRVLDLLTQAQDRRTALCYDARLALPYLGQAAASRYYIGEDNPLGRLAEALVLKRRDPALTAAAFQQYAREPQVVSQLCAGLAGQNPPAAKSTEIQTAYCPAPRPEAQPALTPEQLRRKQAFDRILEESRRGAL